MIVQKNYIRYLTIIIALILSAATINHAKSETLIEIGIDRAGVIPVKTTPNTIVIGNESIANINPGPNNTIVIQGKAYGKTNAILLDQNGKTITTMILNVVDNEHSVELYAAGNRESYVCSQNSCQSEIRIGDSEAHLNKTAAQRKEKGGLALADE